MKVLNFLFQELLLKYGGFFEVRGISNFKTSIKLWKTPFVSFF